MKRFFASILKRYWPPVVIAFAVSLGIGVGLGQIWTTHREATLVSVNIEDLTWTEVAAALERGYDTAIIPTGGTEQNGPHVILGKHNYIIANAAERIALMLGNTLVAPVVAYVPEGDFGTQPSGHMLFPGTISVREEIFAGILEDAARSFATHGFDRIIFIGDSGGNQTVQQSVATRLTAEWEDRGIEVLHIGDYYAANGQTDWLREQGHALEHIGGHAGIRDTSEVIAVHPEGVRTHFVMPPDGMDSGYSGAPSLASEEIGEKMISLKIEAALREIAARSD